MSTRQAESERAIFERFATAVELPITPGSIESREPPEPDIRCTLSNSRPQCFELVEIVDTDLAKAVGIQLKCQTRLESDVLSRKIKGLSDALVFLRFSESITNAQRLQACEALLNVLDQLPEDFHGSIDPDGHAGLAGVVRKLRLTRGDFVGPAFQVDGGTSISDPIIGRIQDKCARKYTTDAPIDLLAYYEMHPADRAEYELPGVDDYVGANLAGSPFSRIWVFDAGNERLVYRS